MKQNDNCKPDGMIVFKETDERIIPCLQILIATNAEIHIEADGDKRILEYISHCNSDKKGFILKEVNMRFVNLKNWFLSQTENEIKRLTIPLGYDIISM